MIKLLKILTIISLFIFAFADINTVFAKKVISVGATISDTPAPPPPPSPDDDPTGGDFKLSCPESFEITALNTVSRLSIPSQNIIVKPSGVIKSFLNNIRLDTNCDLIVMEGGEISVDGPSGGFITLSVGGNMKIDGKISAKGISDAGGYLRFDTGKDLVLDGSIDASGATEGGFIRGDIKGNLKIKNNSIIANGGSGEGGSMRFAVGGNLTNSGNFTANGSTGGFLRIDAEGDADISGTTSVKGNKDGGQIRFGVKGKATISGNSLLADGIIGSGGVITIDAGKNLTISGFYSANGKNGGSLSATSNNDIIISAGAVVSAIGTESNGGSISIKTPKKLSIQGQIKASGVRSPGRIDLNYCAKDFSGAQFNPLPSESVSCFEAPFQLQAAPIAQSQLQTQPFSALQSQSTSLQPESALQTSTQNTQQSNIQTTDANQPVSTQQFSSQNLLLNQSLNQTILTPTNIKLTPSSLISNFQLSPLNSNEK